MAWFSPFTREVVSLTPEEIRPTAPAQLTGIDPDRTSDAVNQGLRAARDRLAALETEGRRIEVEAEKTRLSIAALEAADKVFVAADLDFAEVEELPGQVSVGARLVPRNADAAA